MANRDKEGNAVLIAGGAAGFISLFLGISDIVIGTITGADLSALPADAAGRFADFAVSPLLGLYRLDAINMISSLVGLFLSIALYLVLRENREKTAFLALILAVLGTGAMVAGNAAFAVLDLAGKYAAAVSDTERAVFVAAAEALTARGAHGSLSMFPAFMLPTLANMLFCTGMKGVRGFGKAAPILGLAGNALLAIYLILVSFFPSTRSVAMALAAPGGILALVWTGRVSWSLVRISKVRM